MSRLWAAGLSLGSLFTPAHRGPLRPDGHRRRLQLGCHRQRQPILDWIGYKDVNLMGIKSIGADPSRVYLACGTYTNARTPTGLILAPRTATRACLAESMWAPTDGCF